jgi:small subunit ribosomal protein S13
MARIVGVDLPVQKRAEIALTYIYGVGRTRSNSVLHRAGIDPDKIVRDLTDEEINRIRKILEEEGAVEGAGGSSRLVPIAEAATAGICPCGVSELTPMPEPGKGRARERSPTRRRRARKRNQQAPAFEGR